jgi:hypothetical protein
MVLRINFKPEEGEPPNIEDPDAAQGAAAPTPDGRQPPLHENEIVTGESRLEQSYRV